MLSAISAPVIIIIMDAAVIMVANLIMMHGWC
jgi:hypothetical protein